MANYLLSDENDNIANAVYQDIVSVVTPYHNLGRNRKNADSKYEYENVNRFGLFSEILKGMPVLPYDNIDVLQKFPHGIVTENAVFIPADLYRQVGGIKNDNNFFYESKNYSPLLFIEYLTEMIGHRFGKDFSQEFNTIVEKSLEQKNVIVTKEIDSYKNITHNVKPQFVSNEDLAKLCEVLDIGSSKVIKSWGNDTSFVDNILANSEALNDETHPFSQLKSLVKNTAPANVDPNISLEEFKNLYGIGLSPVNVPKALSTLEAINTKLLNDYPDMNDYINKINEHFTPYLVILNDKEFSIALENFKNQVVTVHPEVHEGNSYTKPMVQIAKNINLYGANENEGITAYMRDILISSLSNYHNIIFDRFSPFDNPKNRVLEKQEDNTYKTPRELRRGK